MITERNVVTVRNNKIDTVKGDKSSSPKAIR